MRVLRLVWISIRTRDDDQSPPWLTRQVHSRDTMRDVNMKSSYAIVRQPLRPDGLRDMLKREHIREKLTGFVWRAVSMAVVVFIGNANQASTDDRQRDDPYNNPPSARTF